ncbi:Methyltransferase type 11 [Pseudonocardia dioxanivorans CB1190]|uniref:Methyltransferase type 11 n=1 Tax=Pseudonocardia dioxanivorans (strain ATCC 55486 / DSM 44775 / JCM 13855 / CB1190) TaxID=675635 RepID=F4CYL2_PSEUX|nr:methyltransferase domain-containing protein [Pseudonocardia dioxanivorans]AEA26582.1 Methyltransferase type 11 [Pseudonocardia dioxanivorans CB1190]
MTAATTAREYLPAMADPRLLPFYDRYSRFLGARDAHWRLLVQAGIEPGTRVLEVGCGTGNLTILAAQAEPAAVVTGIDPDPGAIARANRKARAAGVQVTHRHGFAEDLPLGDGSVDRVLSSFMLHHVAAADRVTALREARRVLAPGGRLHVVDIDRGEVVPLARVLSRIAAGHLRGHGGEGHGHGHGHGQAEGRGEGPDVAALLAEAGFGRVVRLGAGDSRLGGFTFWRAERDA